MGSSGGGGTKASYFALVFVLLGPAPFLLKLLGAVRLSISETSEGFFCSTTGLTPPFGGGFGTYFCSYGYYPSKIQALLTGSQ